MSDTDTARAAFLSAIAANPFDATLRLIFADWLEEQGEQHAADAVRWIAGSGIARKERLPAEGWDKQYYWSFADDFSRCHHLPRSLFLRFSNGLNGFSKLTRLPALIFVNEREAVAELVAACSRVTEPLFGEQALPPTSRRT